MWRGASAVEIRLARPYNPSVSMANWSSAFNLVSWVYLGIAALTVQRLWRAGALTFDDELTAADRRLVGAAAFYLATPIAVALHEFGHAAVVWALGGQIVDVHFMFYWGYVVPKRSFGDYGDLAVALAGNVVSVALGLAAARRVLHHPGRAAWNFFWWRFAEIQLSIALLVYPLMCLAGFGGDFVAIYRLDTAPVSAPLLALHLAYVGWLWRALRGRLGARARLLTGPLWDEMRRAERELVNNPDDVCALLRQGWAQLAVGLHAEAREPIGRALALRPELPAAHAMMGQALVEDDPEAAARELDLALSSAGLDDLLAATSHLALARIEVGRGALARALPHACAALEGIPGDPAAAQLLWEVALEGGGGPRARGALDRAATRGNAIARQAIEALERQRLKLAER